MTLWHVPIKLEQEPDYAALTEDELRDLWIALPGGGFSSSGDEWRNFDRQFMMAIEVEADSAQEAEAQAPDVAIQAIDHQRFPGWRVRHVGEARPAAGGQ